MLFVLSSSLGYLTRWGRCGKHKRSVFLLSHCLVESSVNGAFYPSTVHFFIFLTCWSREITIVCVRVKNDRKVCFCAASVVWNTVKELWNSEILGGFRLLTATCILQLHKAEVTYIQKYSKTCTRNSSYA